MTGDALRGSAAHVFVDDLASPTLGDADHHHLERVLRLRPGQVVSLSDGRGAYRMSEWTGRVDGPFDGLGPEMVRTRPSTTLAVWVSAVKGDRLDWAVQKLTEVGADLVGVFGADRSVVTWDGDRRRKQQARLGRIAREAAMQSRRCTLPEIIVERSLADVVSRHNGVERTPPGLVRAEPNGAPAAPGGDVAICIGPEGGWSPAEATLVPATWAISSQVLRTETAAIVAAVLVERVRQR